MPMDADADTVPHPRHGDGSRGRAADGDAGSGHLPGEHLLRQPHRRVLLTVQRPRDDRVRIRWDGIGCHIQSPTPSRGEHLDPLRERLRRCRRPSGTKTVQFDWPALSVNNQRTYEVAVYQNGAFVQSESFLLRPRLVTITSVSPTPFFPWIDDGTRTPRTSGSLSPRMPRRKLGSTDRRQPGSAAEPSFETRASATSRPVTTPGIGTAGTTTATTSPKATTSSGSGPTTGAWHRLCRKRRRSRSLAPTGRRRRSRRRRARITTWDRSPHSSSEAVASFSGATGTFRSSARAPG